MTIKTFEDVVAWQKGKELYLDLYQETLRCKNFSFRDQLMRAALSITNNIAEGFDRGTNKELKQFLVIARGSAAEVRSMLLIGPEVDSLTKEAAEKNLILVKDISRLLTGFIKSLN